MPQLELRRAAPLTADERGALPLGCEVVHSSDGVVARAAAPESAADLVALAVLLARAVPDGSVAWVETALAPSTPPARDPSPSPSPAPRPANPDASAWQLLEAGDFDAAEALLVGTELDTDGRAVVRALLQDTDPARVAAGCRVARITGWRSSASNLRRLLQHGDTRVRLAAVEAVGALAGPGLVPVLLRMSGSDASPEVRVAAEAAIEAIEGGADAAPAR